MEQQQQAVLKPSENKVKSVWKQFVQNEQVLHFPKKKTGKTIDGKIMIEVHEKKLLEMK